MSCGAHVGRNLYLQAVDAWQWDRYPDPKDGATRPGAPGGAALRRVVERDHGRHGRASFLRAFVAGARAARRTGHRGYRAREWALRFAWATVAP